MGEGRVGVSGPKSHRGGGAAGGGWFGEWVGVAGKSHSSCVCGGGVWGALEGLTRSFCNVS